MSAPSLLSKCCNRSIGTPSVSCTTRGARSEQPRRHQRTRDWLESLGFRTTVQPLPNKPGKANLIATTRRRQRRPRARRTHRHGPVRRRALVAEPVRADRTRRTPLRSRHVRHEGLLPDRDRGGAAVRRREAHGAADDRRDVRRRVVDGRRAALAAADIPKAAVRDDRRTDRLPADLRAQRLHDVVDRAAGRVGTLVGSRPRPQRARCDALRDGRTARVSRATRRDASQSRFRRRRCRR